MWIASYILLNQSNEVKTMPRSQILDNRTSEQAYGEGKRDAENGKTEGDLRWEQAAQDLVLDVVTSSDSRSEAVKSYDQGVKDGQK